VTQRVFVYGSLRRGESHHRLLRRPRFLGTHETEARYTMFDLGRYPAVVDGGSSTITGEVFAIHASVLSTLDVFEDCPGEYVRTQIPTRYGEAWIYLYRQASAASAIIPSGDWCNRDK